VLNQNIFTTSETRNSSARIFAYYKEQNSVQVITCILILMISPFRIARKSKNKLVYKGSIWICPSVPANSRCAEGASRKDIDTFFFNAAD